MFLMLIDQDVGMSFESLAIKILDNIQLRISSKIFAILSSLHSILI